MESSLNNKTFLLALFFWASQAHSTVIDEVFWAKYYNAEDRPLEERIRDYRNAQDIKPTMYVEIWADYAVNSGAFDYEMQDLGISKEEMYQGMLNISKIETSGGHLDKSKQVSPTGAMGLFQIVESTARSVLENGQFGSKAAKASGYSLDYLNSMSRSELRESLLDDDLLNAMFSAAIIVQKLQHKRNLQTN